MATYGDQNVGARRYDRLNKGLFSCLVIGCIYAVIVWIILVNFNGQLATFFLKQDATEEILKNVHTYVLWNSSFYIPLAFVNIVRYMVQGMGFSRVAIFAGIIEFVSRMAVAWILVPRAGYLGVCYTNPITWTGAAIFLVIIYFVTRRKLIRDADNMFAV